MPTAFTIGIIEITFGVISTILAIVGWILLDEIRYEYLLFSIILPTISMFLCGMCAIGFIRKSLHSLLIGIIFFATLCVASEIFSIASHSYILYIFITLTANVNKTPEIVVASIALVLSCTFAIFNGYVIVKFTRYLYTVNSALAESNAVNNNQQSEISSNTTSTSRFPFADKVNASTIQLVAGAVSLIIGLVSLVVLQGGFAPANCYLGSVMLASGTIGHLTNKLKNIKSLNSWSLVTSRWSCLWALALIVSSTLYLIFEAVFRRPTVAYIIFYVLIIISGLVDFVAALCISLKTARLESVPVFKLTLLNRLRLPITAQNITFGLVLCIFGALLMIVTFIEPFVGIPTHLLYTFVTGCQLILAGQLGNNLAFKYSEDLVATYFIINFMASAFTITYAGLLIAERISAPAFVGPSVIAMIVVNYVLILPALTISLYETIITGYRSGICICGESPSTAMLDNNDEPNEQTGGASSPVETVDRVYTVHDGKMQSIQALPPSEEAQV